MGPVPLSRQSQGDGESDVQGIRFGQRHRQRCPVRDGGYGVAQSGDLDALIALEHIATRRLYRRDEEIYAEGDAADGWYKVISGACTSPSVADRRRHVAEFFLPATASASTTPARMFSAEAISDVDRHCGFRARDRAADRRMSAARSTALRDDAARSCPCADADAPARADDGARTRRAIPDRAARSVETLTVGSKRTDVPNDMAEVVSA